MRRIRYAEILLLTVSVALYVVISSTAQQTVATSLTITDADPHGLSVDNCAFAGTTKSDGGSYTPSAATNYTLNCTVSAFDINGFADIDTVWGQMFFHSNGLASCDTAAEFDADDCYFDASCAAISGTGSGQGQSYHCDFGSAAYYADTGTWNFTAYVNDSNGGTTLTNTTSYTIASLKSINSSATLSFGTQAVGTVTTASTDLFIENQGNNDLTISVQGNEDMGCTTGTIAIGKIVYDADADTGDNTAYISACGALSKVDAWGCTALTIVDVETPADANYVRGTYWGINVTSGVSGTCNNSMTFTAA